MTNLLWTHSSVGESAELIPLESVEGSSPSGSTMWTDSLSGLSAGLKIQRMKVRHLLGPPIYPFSSTDRMLGYELSDKGSIPLGDTTLRRKQQRIVQAKNF